jgi:DNA-binding NtrC family response regulator
MREALLRQAWDVVISDYEMPGFGGFEALQILKESGHDLPFILVSAVVNEETAVAAMKAGAHDYIMKRSLPGLCLQSHVNCAEAQSREARKAAEAALRQSEEQFVKPKNSKPLAASRGRGSRLQQYSDHNHLS